MFDATDLFQLQQWAGDISATEVYLSMLLIFSLKVTMADG